MQPLLKIFFQSILVVPVILGLELGRLPGRRRSLPLLLALLLAYGIAYMLLLHHIRGRWI
jgi:hypothetical protein